MSSKNEAIVAAAGSGKTDYLIEKVQLNPDRRILILSYTTENLQQIENRLWSFPGGYPNNVTSMTLFAFLLNECVKPFQIIKTDIPNFVRSIHTDPRPSTAQFAGVSNFAEYFLNQFGDVYSDYLSQAAVELNNASEGEVIRRIALIWDELYIDEAQDLNGYDLDFLDEVLKCQEINVAMVSDPRQAVYRANRLTRNKKYRGAGFVNWLDERPYVTREHLTGCHRSIQEICDIADSLYPDLPAATSQKLDTSRQHIGVYLVRETDLEAYIDTYAPQELRWDRTNKKAGHGALNMRAIKGLSFEDVLIHPTKTMIDHLETRAPIADISLAALYVAITRAEYSVGIVTKRTTSQSSIPFWHNTHVDKGNADKTLTLF